MVLITLTLLARRRPVLVVDGFFEVLVFLAEVESETFLADVVVFFEVLVFLAEVESETFLADLVVFFEVLFFLRCCLFICLLSFQQFYSFLN